MDAEATAQEAQVVDPSLAWLSADLSEEDDDDGDEDEMIELWEGDSDDEHPSATISLRSTTCRLCQRVYPARFMIAHEDTCAREAERVKEMQEQVKTQAAEKVTKAMKQRDVDHAKRFLAGMPHEYDWNTADRSSAVLQAEPSRYRDSKRAAARRILALILAVEAWSLRG